MASNRVCRRNSYTDRILNMWHLVPTENGWKSLFPLSFHPVHHGKDCHSEANPLDGFSSFNDFREHVDQRNPRVYARRLRIHHLRVQLGIQSQPPSPQGEPHKKKAELPQVRQLNREGCTVERR